MRRALPTAALAARADMDREKHGADDTVVLVGAREPEPEAETPREPGTERVTEVLHGMRHYIVRRQKHGAISLHREYDGTPHCCTLIPPPPPRRSLFPHEPSKPARHRSLPAGGALRGRRHVHVCADLFGAVGAERNDPRQRRHLLPRQSAHSSQIGWPLCVCACVRVCVCVCMCVCVCYMYTDRNRSSRTDCICVAAPKAPLSAAAWSCATARRPSRYADGVSLLATHVYIQT